MEEYEYDASQSLADLPLEVLPLIRKHFTMFDDLNLRCVNKLLESTMPADPALKMAQQWSLAWDKGGTKSPFLETEWEVTIPRLMRIGAYREKELAIRADAVEILSKCGAEWEPLIHTLQLGVCSSAGFFLL